MTVVHLSHERVAPRAARRPWLAHRTVLVVVDVAVLLVVLSDLPPARLAVLTAAAVACIGLQGGYRRRFTDRAVTSLAIIVASLAGPLVLFGAVQGVNADLERALRLLPVACGAMLLARTVGTFLLRRSPDSGAPVLILGAGVIGARLASDLQRQPEFGLDPVGFVDRVQDHDLPVPVLGDVDALEEIVERTGARHLIIAYGLVPETELVDVVRRCQLLDLDVWAVPRFFELGLGSSRVLRDEIRGIQLAGLPRLALRSREWRLKRVFDVVVASLGLIVAAPALLVIAAAVKLTSHGPVFFKQCRIGQRGEPFDVLKFRTMAVNQDSATTWSVERDPRITPLGRVLRRLSLDELPQLWNVLRGDMSLVGPRPERPHFVDLFAQSVQRYGDRHRVPVGMTGLAQVNGLRGDTNIDQRALYDNLYIESWSLWLDVTILVRTLVAVVRPPDRRVAAGPSATHPTLRRAVEAATDPDTVGSASGR